MERTKAIALALASILLAGCDELPSGSLPVDEVPDAVGAYHRTVEAWDGMGLPEAAIESCSSERVFVGTFSPEKFRAVTGFCAMSACDESCKGWCAYAVTTPLERSSAVLIALPDSLSERDRGGALAHEMTHYVAMCTGYRRDGDRAHADDSLWKAGGVVSRSYDLCREDGECR